MIWAVFYFSLEYGDLTKKEMFAQNTHSHVFQLVLRLLVVLFGKLYYQISPNLCNTLY